METSKIFHGEYSRKFPGDIQPRALMRLRQLHRIIAIDQLRQPPSNRLESLSGNLKGFWSIRINQQWRIVFRWKDGNAADVQITDYHRLSLSHRHEKETATHPAAQLLRRDPPRNAGGIQLVPSGDRPSLRHSRAPPHPDETR